MKNATKHADALKSLVKKSAKDVTVPPLEVIDPLRALVRSCFCFDTTDARAAEALAAIDKEFVDLNELRVATELELQEIVGLKFPQIEKRCHMLRSILMMIFEREGTLSFERVKGLNKKELRQTLRELPTMTPFVEAYTALYGFEAAAFPMDDSVLSLLKDSAAVEDETTLDEAQKFVEQNVKADDVYTAWYALRSAAVEADKGRKKK
jgi:endonuclease III